MASGLGYTPGKPVPELKGWPNRPVETLSLDFSGAHGGPLARHIRILAPSCNVDGTVAGAPRFAIGSSRRWLLSSPFGVGNDFGKRFQRLLQIFLPSLDKLVVK